MFVLFQSRQLEGDVVYCLKETGHRDTVLPGPIDEIIEQTNELGNAIVEMSYVCLNLQL